MKPKYDLLFETLKRIATVRQQLAEACLNYKLIGITIHPDDSREIQEAGLAHSIFGTDFSLMVGMFVRVDPNVEPHKPQLIMELPE